jgi:hypothetical protein
MAASFPAPNFFEDLSGVSMSSVSIVLLATFASESGVRRRRISLPLIPEWSTAAVFLDRNLPPAAGKELRPMASTQDHEKAPGASLQGPLSRSRAAG